MTQEQAIKHKNVIKWWLDNPSKGVWVKEHGTDWELLTSEYDIKFYLGAKYIQNDEYAEYRMALVDGIVVEYHYKVAPKGQWFPQRDLSPHETFTSDKRYRIKPDEPKFKVGDWVRFITCTDKSCIVKHKEHDNLYSDNDPDAELWQPQEGDVVLGIRKGMTPCLMTYKDYKCQVDNFVSFNKIIPYIGQNFEEMI